MAENNTTRKAAAKQVANAAAAAVKERQDRQEIARHQARFLADYEAHIQAILHMPSGTHAVNPQKLEDWITSQQSDSRREVARALSQHITYITHQEVIDRCRDLVEQFYTQYLPQQGMETPTIVLFTHRRGKSGYMIALLFYYWVQQLGFQVPHIMTDALYPHLIKDPTCVFAYTDDMSYSGSQLSQILSKYAILPAFIEKTAFPKFWIGFVAMTEYAQRQLAILIPFQESGVSSNFVKNIVNKNPAIAQYNMRPPQTRRQDPKYIKIQNPFTVYASRVIPSLRAQMGDIMYVAARVFFNSEDADCIVYFDHKVADSPSTFMRVLVFGPVPAVNASFVSSKYDKKTPDEDDSYEFWSYDKDLLSIRTYDRGKDGTATFTQFKPFIDGCPAFSEEDKAKWGQVPYSDFMSGQKMSDGPWPVPPSTFDMTEIRCPQSWYKTMFAQEGGIRRGRTIRRKTRKSKNKNKK